MKKMGMVIGVLWLALPLCAMNNEWQNAKKQAIIRKSKKYHRYDANSWRTKGTIGFYKDREHFVGDVNPQAIELAILEKEYKGVDPNGRYPQHQFLFLKGHYEKSFYDDRARRYVQELPLKELDKKDFNGQTPLAIAAWMGKASCVELLVKAQCDVNSVSFKERRTILHLMIRNAKNATVHESNTGFWTNNKIQERPSYGALLAVAKALNRKGTLDINAKDSNGKTAYDWLLSYGDTKLHYNKNMDRAEIPLDREELKARKELLSYINPHKHK